MRRRLWLWPAGLLALAISGCAATPSSRLADARAQIVALREENARWRDQVAALKARNRDIAERAVEDARRIAALEEANGRLEQSIGGYQQERDELHAAV